MATLTEQVQTTIRALTSTSGTYTGDWHALFDLKSLAKGQWGERLLAYYNLTTNAGAQTVSAAHNYYLLNPASIV